MPDLSLAPAPIPNPEIKNRQPYHNPSTQISNSQPCQTPKAGSHPPPTSPRGPPARSSSNTRWSTQPRTPSTPCAALTRSCPRITRTPAAGPQNTSRASSSSPGTRRGRFTGKLVWERSPEEEGTAIVDAGAAAARTQSAHEAGGHGTATARGPGLSSFSTRAPARSARSSCWVTNSACIRRPTSCRTAPL